MKRAGHLIPPIAEYANLELAFWKAARGRRRSPSVRAFSDSLHSELNKMSHGILDGSVTVGMYSRFVVRDPKARIIHAASFRERVLHHGIFNICGPILERGAIHDSYACRRGKGNNAALSRARHFAARNAFFLKMDIRRFFDSISHNILKQRLRRLFKDAALLRLLDRIIDSYCVQPGKGLPIGTLSSQYFANFYLDGLDRFVKEHLRCRSYLRFMDDFVLWGDSRDLLEANKHSIETWLHEVLHLQLKIGTRLAATGDGMSFLGFRIFPRAILLGFRARRRFRDQLRAYYEAYEDGLMDMAELQRRSDSLVAHTEQASCRAWRRRIVTELNQECMLGTVD